MITRIEPADTAAIEITQDYEFDEDFGLGSPMLSFWAPGHGHDHEQFRCDE